MGAMGGGAWGGAETRQKHRQMIEQGMFLDVWTTSKNAKY